MVTTIEYQMVWKKVFTCTGIENAMPNRLVSVEPSKTFR